MRSAFAKRGSPFCRTGQVDPSRPSGLGGESECRGGSGPTHDVLLTGADPAPVMLRAGARCVMGLPCRLALLVVLAFAASSAGAYDPTRYVHRPLQGGTQDAVYVPIVIGSCFETLREGFIAAPMTVHAPSAAEAWWLRSTINVTLDVLPSENACPAEPGREPIVAVRLGTLPPGEHRIIQEIRHFAPGEDEPSGSSTGEIYVRVLGHPRFESGFWYEPAKPGHGMSLIVRSGEARQLQGEPNEPFVMPQSLYLSWQTYDREGRPLWLVGAAPDGSAHPLRIEVFQHEGMPYPALDPAGLLSTRWGEATLTAEACGRLKVLWRPDAPGLPPRIVQFHRFVGTEELPYCEPHPTWRVIPAQRVDG